MENVGMGMSVYFQSLERLLDCPKPLRSSFLSQTRRMAEDFAQGRPEATREELVGYLGEPEELAQGFLETLEPEVLERYRKRKKFLMRGCIAVLIAALVVVSAWGIHLVKTPKTPEVVETIVIYPEFTEET